MNATINPKAILNSNLINSLSFFLSFQTQIGLQTSSLNLWFFAKKDTIEKEGNLILHCFAVSKTETQKFILLG